MIDALARGVVHARHRHQQRPGQDNEGQRETEVVDDEALLEGACGEREGLRGLGEEHDGIIVLPSDAEVGTLAKDYYGIKEDVLIEVDITPNRVDATSHYGVARDLAAYFSLHDDSVTLKKPSVEAFRTENTSLPIPVRVENENACPRYSAVTISGATVTESPKWLKEHLLNIGQRPINNIVDITNFVLHELGQPLHAFDADKITSGEVREIGRAHV